MTRKEIYEIIKTNCLEEDVKEAFDGKNYTNIPTIELECFVAKLHKIQEHNKRRLSGMTESDNNDICNKKILEKLSLFFDNTKGITFRQGLYRLFLTDKMKDESSQQTLWRINQYMNAHKRIKSLTR